MYDCHLLHSCLDEPIYRYELHSSLTMEFAEHLRAYGCLTKPIESKPLARMETDGFVLIASLRTDEFRLRFKTSGESDVQQVKADIDRALEQYLRETRITT